MGEKTSYCNIWREMKDQLAAGQPLALQIKHTQMNVKLNSSENFHSHRSKRLNSKVFDTYKTTSKKSKLAPNSYGTYYDNFPNSVGKLILITLENIVHSIGNTFESNVNADLLKKFVETALQVISSNVSGPTKIQRRS